MNRGAWIPYWVAIRNSRTARGRFRNTSTYTVAMVEASLLEESLVTPTIVPRMTHSTMLSRVTLAELMIAAFRNSHLASEFASTSIGHGLILKVFTLSMKSNLTIQRFCITGSGSCCR